MPMEVVATTLPFWSVESTPLSMGRKALPLTPRFVVDALTKNDDEDANSPVTNQLGVVVALVVVPYVVRMLQSHGLVRVTDPPRETSPPPVRPLPAVTVMEEFCSWLLPIVEVATTEPSELVVRSAEGNP